jgi:hypothetical protein
MVKLNLPSIADIHEALSRNEQERRRLRKLLEIVREQQEAQRLPKLDIPIEGDVCQKAHQ